MTLRTGLAAALLCASGSASPAQAPAQARAEPSQLSSAESVAVRVAVQALASGQTAVTISVAPFPTETLPERLNRLHLRLGLLGWQFAAQEFVSDHTGNGVLLLSYRR